MAEPLVDVRGLSLQLGPGAAISGVGFSLCAGDVIGLVGANGGGKTTTLRMLAGLARPGGGSGHVLGADVCLAKRPSRLLGYMPQRNALYPELSVRENLRFHCGAYGIADARSAIVRQSRTYGLDAVIDRRVAHLSGGWARRAQFAATTLHAPRLLLLDEPTAGLDPRARRDLWSWISDMAASGCGIIVSTHDLAEAEALPQIVYYQDGKASPICTPRELMIKAGAQTLEDAVIGMASRS